MTETSTAAPPEQAPAPAPAARRARPYATSPGRMRTRNVAIGTGLLGGGAAAVQSLVTFGPAATIAGGAVTVASTGGAYVYAKTRKRRTSNAARPGAAARRSLMSRSRARKNPTSNPRAGQTRKARRVNKAATQRATAGRKATPAAARGPLGPQNRDKNGRFGRGHARLGGLFARKSGRNRKATAPAGFATTAGNRANRTVRKQARAERKTTRRTAAATARTARAARRTAATKVRAAHRTAAATAKAARRTAAGKAPRRAATTVRPIGGLGRRAARVFGRLWFFVATKVGNGVRSANWLRALAEPFRDITPTKPVTAQPKPAEATPAAETKPTTPPSVRDGMNLPKHPVTAAKVTPNPGTVDLETAKRSSKPCPRVHPATGCICGKPAVGTYCVAHQLDHCPWGDGSCRNPREFHNQFCTPHMNSLESRDKKPSALAAADERETALAETMRSTPVPVPNPAVPATTGRNTTMAVAPIDFSDFAGAIHNWNPDDPDDTTNLLQSMPDGLSEIAQAFMAKAEQLRREKPYADITATGFEGIGQMFAAASTASESMHGEFESANAAGLEVHRSADPNKQHWTQTQ